MSVSCLRTFDNPHKCLIPKFPKTTHFCLKSPLTSQLVGPICLNTNPTRHCLWWPGICHFMVTHNSHNSSKKICSAKGRCQNMDLTSMSWRASLSKPGSDLHHPNWLFCPSDPQPLGPKLSDFASNIYGYYQGSSCLIRFLRCCTIISTMSPETIQSSNSCTRFTVKPAPPSRQCCQVSISLPTLSGGWAGPGQGNFCWPLALAQGQPDPGLVGLGQGQPWPSIKKCSTNLKRCIM